MSSRLIGFTGLTHTKFLTTTESILLNLEKHPDTPKEVPKPYPSVPDLRASFEKYKELHHAAENGDRVKGALRNLARETTADDFSNYGHFLLTYGMDTYFLLDVGYSVKQQPVKKNAPAIASRVPPQKAKVKHGEVPGKLIVSCSRQNGAAMYGVGVSEDPSAEGNWRHVDNYIHASKMEVTGLTPGKRYYFRICNIGGDGPGPWSDTVTLICM